MKKKFFKSYNICELALILFGFWILGLWTEGWNSMVAVSIIDLFLIPGLILYGVHLYKKEKLAHLNASEQTEEYCGGD